MPQDALGMPQLQKGVFLTRWGFSLSICQRGSPPAPWSLVGSNQASSSSRGPFAVCRVAEPLSARVRRQLAACPVGWGEKVPRFPTRTLGNYSSTRCGKAGHVEPGSITVNPRGDTPGSSLRAHPSVGAVHIG